MDADLYQRVSELFSQARARSPETRESFLEVACGEDRELKRLVLEFLTYDSSLPPSVSLIDSSALELNTGDIVRNYRIDRLLGEGGMGLVYLAHQVEPVRRLVALKVMRAGLDTKTLLKRFDRERQVLALMEHPNIARVFDAGSTEAGRPFFVMEYVPGVPITLYCDERRLPIETRLRLFIDVCQAVQHAHQKSVVHRDIKPSNILVSEIDHKPIPKVIDFGIAKALEDGSSETLSTQQGVQMGTPEYMSPEQTTNREVDTRTDVYSLGVILYELLVGRRPFERSDFTDEALTTLRQAVASSEPRRPSTTLRDSSDPHTQDIAANRMSDSHRLYQLLRTDLDWIAIRALEKEPSRRYASASELAADVERYLARELVIARPPTAPYRARKYLRKHRILVTSTSVVVAVLLAGVAATTWQAHKAQERLSRMEDVSRQLVSRFYDLADQVGGMATKKTLASMATVTLDDVSKRRALTIEEHRQLANSYEALAQVQGDAYSSSIGDVIGGRESLAKAYPHRVTAYASDSMNVVIANEMIKICYMRASFHQGDYTVGGFQLLKRGIGIGKRLLGQQHDPTTYVLVSTCQQLLAEYESDAGRVESELDQLEQCRTLRSELLAMDPANIEYQRLMADIDKTISHVTTNDSLSVALASAALEMNRSYAAAKPFSWRGLMDLSYAHRNMGYAWRRVHRFDDSLAEMKKCLAVRERMAAADTSDYRAQFFVEEACHLVGCAFADLAIPDSSLAYDCRGLSILNKLSRKSDRPDWFGYELSYSSEFVAEQFAARGDTTRARWRFTNALSYTGASDASGRLRLMRLQEEYAHFVDAAGDSVESVARHQASFDQALLLCILLRDNNASPIAWSDAIAEFCHIADFCAPSNPALAWSAAQLASQYAVQELGPLHPLTARAMSIEAAISAIRGDREYARERYRRLMVFQPPSVLFCRACAALTMSNLELLTRHPDLAFSRKRADSQQFFASQSQLIKRNRLWGHQPWPSMEPLRTPSPIKVERL